MGPKIEVVNITQNIDKHGNGGVMVRFKVWKKPERAAVTRIVTFKVEDWSQNLSDILKNCAVQPGLASSFLEHLGQHFMLTLFRLQGVHKRWSSQNSQRT